MNALTEAENLVARLTRAEKAQLMCSLARELGETALGLAIEDGVCGGSAHIVRTRIPVWTLEQARRLGATDTDILRAYPSLRSDDLANAWAHVAGHLDEIEREIQENEEA